MIYKTHKTSKYTRNSYFPKNREIRFSRDISRSSAPYAPFFPLLTLTTITIDYNNLNVPSPALHTVHYITTSAGNECSIFRP